MLKNECDRLDANAQEPVRVPRPERPRTNESAATGTPDDTSERSDGKGPRGTEAEAAAVSAADAR